MAKVLWHLARGACEDGHDDSEDRPDVACALDRAIYAPPQIAVAYRESLDERFFGLLDDQ